MNNATAVQTPARVSESPRVVVPTWASLKTAWGQAETSGRKAQRKAYDTIVRAFALTDATGTDAKGAVAARSDRERGREVIDALKVSEHNPFGVTDVRIGQVVKVYSAIARSGADPFSDQGIALYAGFETIRRNDLDSLNKAADQVKGAKSDARESTLADAVTASKEAKKARTAANKATPGTSTTVKDLAGVQAIAEAMLPMVRKVSATADPKAKAAAKKALEALIAHLA